MPQRAEEEAGGEADAEEDGVDGEEGPNGAAVTDGSEVVCIVFLGLNVGSGARGADGRAGGGPMEQLYNNPIWGVNWDIRGIWTAVD